MYIHTRWDEIIPIQILPIKKNWKKESEMSMIIPQSLKT